MNSRCRCDYVDLCCSSGDGDVVVAVKEPGCGCNDVNCIHKKPASTLARSAVNADEFLSKGTDFANLLQ